MKIKTRMLISISIPFISSILIIFTLLVIMTINQISNTLDSTLRNQTRSLATNVSELVITSARSYIKAIGEITNVNLKSIELPKKTFLKNGYIYLVNIEGIIIAHPDISKIGTDSLTKDWLQNTNKNEPSYYQYQMDNRDKLLYKIFNNKLNIYIMTTVYADDFASSLEVSELIRILNNTNVNENAYPMILTPDGLVIYDKNPAYIGLALDKIPDNSNDKDILKAMTSDHEGNFNYYWKDKNGQYSEKSMYFIYEKNSNYLIASTGYTKDFYENVNKMIFIIISLLLSIITITLIIILRISSVVTKPIIMLSEFSKEITNGNININIPPSGTDEIDTLAQNFQFMGTSIKEKMIELSNYGERLEDTVDERTKELQNTISVLNETQEQLIQSEKMSSLGSLVAGVAHEINTPIGIGVTIASNIESETSKIQKCYNNDSMSKSIFESYMKDMEVESKILLSNMNRAANLVQSFKQVAVDQSIEQKRKFNVLAYINELLLSLNHKLKFKDIKIDIKCDKNLILDSYPGALSQILTNIILNSYIHGFENMNKGSINIIVTKVDELYTLIYSDNGIGIDENIIDKIFDPFFTTKRNNGGTGLGLHLIFNLVTQTLGGNIKCNSKLHEGAEFIISFK